MHFKATTMLKKTSQTKIIKARTMNMGRIMIMITTMNQMKMIPKKMKIMRAMKTRIMRMKTMMKMNMKKMNMKKMITMKMIMKKNTMRRRIMKKMKVTLTIMMVIKNHVKMKFHTKIMK